MNAIPVVSAFAWVPDFAKGHVRDLRVRWAHEEAGLPYEVRKLMPGPQPADYLAHQPFGQVPAYQDGEVDMFESGAIVLHIAERSEVLMPKDPVGRAKVQTWIFCALNTMEVPVGMLAEIDTFSGGAAWGVERRPAVEAWVVKRLGELSARLGDKPYLTGTFSAGDILMTDVLRNLEQTDLVERHANLGAYKARCMARPAFKTAYAAQMADFTGSPPPGWGGQ